MIGPSRSGKTVNVIAGLLEWNGPAVVVSVKRDLIDATRVARAVRGECRVFDPSGVARLPAELLARWSPLRAATTPRSFSAEVQATRAMRATAARARSSSRRSERSAPSSTKAPPEIRESIREAMDELCSSSRRGTDGA